MTDSKAAAALLEALLDCEKAICGCNSTKHVHALNADALRAIARYGDLREKDGYERGYNESKVCVCHIPSPDPCPRHP